MTRQKPRWARALQALGRSLYLLLVQSAVGAVWLVLAVYFLLNAPSAAGLVSQVVSDVLPGTLEVGHLRIGPKLGHVRAGHLRITEPGGRTVLAVREAELQIQLFRLVDALWGERGLELAVEKAKVRGVDVRLENDRLGRLLLTQAFADPDKPPSDKPGMPLRLDVRGVELEDGTFLMDLPAIKLWAQGAALAGDFHMRSDGVGPPRMRYHADYVTASAAQVLPSAMRTMPQLPPGSMQVRLVDGGLDGVQVRTMTGQFPARTDWHLLTLPDTVVLRGRVEVGLEPGRVTVVGSDLWAATSTRSSFLGPLLGNLFDAEAIVEGDFRVDPELGFSTEGKVLGRGKISGFQTQRIEGKVRVETGAPGDAAVRVVGERIDVLAYGGQISAPRLTYRLEKDAPVHHVAGQFRVADLRPEGPLHSEAVQMQGIVPLSLQGRLTGDVGVGVRVELPEAKAENLGKDMELDVALDTDLTLHREGLGSPLKDELPHLHARGGMQFGMGPRRMVVHLDDVLVHTGATPRPTFLDRHAWIRADGRLDLVARDSRLTVAAHVPRLQDVLEPLGVSGISGALTLRDTRVEGGLAAPGVIGDLVLDDVQYQDLVRIRSARTRLKLVDGNLKLDRLSADTDLGQVSGDVALGLFGKVLADKRSKRTLAVERLKVQGLDLGNLLPRFGIAEVTGILDIDDGSVRTTLENVKGALRLHARVHGRDLVAYGEPIPRASAVVAAQGTRFEVADLRVELATGQVVTAAGSYDLNRQRFTAELDVPVVDLAAFRNVAKLGLPLRGAVGAVLKAEGDRRGFEVHARVEGRGLAWDKYELGSAEIAIDKQRTGPMVFSSQRFFQHLRLLPGSEVAFSGFEPTGGTVRLATDGPLDPFAWLNLEPPQGMLVKVDGEVAATVSRKGGKLDWAIEAQIPPAGLFIDLGGGLQALRNTSVTAVTLTSKGWSLGSTFFDLYRESFEVCGSGDFGDKEAGRAPSMAVFAAGTIDVPRIGPLTQSLADLDLRIDILSDPVVAADPRSQCLHLAQAGRGRLRVEQIGDDFRIQGLLQTQQSRVTLRRFGHDIVLDKGGRLQVATVPIPGSNLGGRLRLEIPRSHPIQGGIDDGRFSAWGTTVLKDLLPEKIDLAVTARDIPVTSPKEYQMSATPDVRFVGTDLQDPAERRMVLSGTVNIGEGAYFKNFDKVGSLVGGVAERRVESYSKPITETMPWIKEIELQLEVLGRNLEVTSRLPFGKTDVLTEFDLEVAGTLAGLRIYNRAKVVEGSDSQVSLALNNLAFRVEHAWLDFQGDPLRPHVDILVAADIPVRSGGDTGTSLTTLGADLTTDTSIQDEVVVVQIQISGLADFKDLSNFKDLKLELSSNKGDKREDVMCLIATRRRCNESGPGGSPRITTDLYIEGLLAGAKRISLVKDIIGQFDTFSFGVDPAGGFNAEIGKKLGKAITIGTKVQTGREQRYSATFQFRITDRLSLNGLWRRQQLTDTTSTQGPPTDVYESKLRYKVPIED